ncbi:DUF6152 family protein [Jannaschia donghaensis]|uniref:Uncharacterized protein n=1 Tax=Jannaschia donghaensis TaxID=420998 RepID=A0A0M6YN66_9RHOB|nr:DUF6152 family protein [Jannaschia donghaensis]CTQ51289.1 hypothetical protein JDO7802_03328 [Jannaschia donghaensis]
MPSLQTLGLTATLSVFPLTVLAHHGVSGQFDMSQSYEVTGTITRISLVNPHAYVYFDVADEGGDMTNMRCELTSGSLLRRSGWTEEMFEIGSEITIEGSPDRDDPTTCHMNEITFANGVTANRESTFGEDGTLDVAEREVVRADGTPNIDGNWAVANPRERGGGRPSVTLTDAGEAAIADASPEQNPRFNCQPTNIVMDWVFNGMVNAVEQTETEITLTYGFMDLVRTIHLDGDTPDAIEPSRAGYSVGNWDSDALVVTTTGFDEGWIMAPIGGRAGVLPNSAEAAERPEHPERPEGGRGPQPVKNSTELTVTERFTLSDDGTVLTRDYAFIDPLYLEAPIEGVDEVVLTTDAYRPYDCEDLTNERTE